MEFLPSFPLPVNQFALLGLVLLAGLIGGELAARTRLVPRIAGYIAVGLLVGPAGFGWLKSPMLGEARIFIDISLGFILFELGRRLDGDWLRHDRAIVRTALAECLLVFALLFLTLAGFGFPLLPSALAASIGMVTSPAVVMMVARDLHAEGPVTRRTLTLVALGNLLALTVFTLLLPYARHGSLPLAQGLYRLSGSILLGGLMFVFASQAARLTGKRVASQFVLQMSLVIIAIALANALHLSVMLSLLSFGIAARNLDHARRLMEVDFGLLGLLFLILLFVITGAHLRLDGFASAGLAVLAFLFARFLGKGIGVLLFARGGRQTLAQAGLTTLALTPMAGVAIGMTHTVSDLNPDFDIGLSAVVLAACAVLDIVGPIATQFALRRAGEAHPEAAT